MPEKLPITAVITTFNSSRTLLPVLHAINNLVNEIILVDSGSTDSTLETGKKYNVKVIPAVWYGYGQNKNIGIDSAQNDWILSIDSDEVISTELIEYLRNNWMALSTQTSIFKIKSIAYIGSHAILYGGWGSVYNYRLFKKSIARWEHSAVHEGLLYDTNLIQPIKIEQPILHHTVENIMEYKVKLDKYAYDTAVKYKSLKIKVYFFSPACSAIFLFLKEYILQLGFLDGKDGFYLAVARSSANFKKYKLLINLYKNA